MHADLRRAHVGVAEQFLRGADVLPRFQQMRREAVPQRVAGGGFGDARAPHRVLHGTLQYRLVQVMPALDSATRIDAARAGGKHVLPRPFTRRARIFPLQRMRQPDRAETGRKVALAHASRLGQLRLQHVGGHRQQHGAPVLAALACAHGDLAPHEIDVLHAQAHAFHQPQPRTVQQRGHQPRHSSAPAPPPLRRA